jgi:hypothetical protein
VREQFREKDWYLNPFPPPKRRAARESHLKSH